VPTWSDIGQFRAATAPTRLGESEQIGAVRSQVTRVFQTWTAALRELNLGETHRLAWNGRAWNIREIRWPMGNEPMCDVIAESGVGDAIGLEEAAIAALLLEDGSYLLTESGDHYLLG